jgi:hypothetical protein
MFGCRQIELHPEGATRESLCRKLQISIDNDFELLKQMGLK